MSERRLHTKAHMLELVSNLFDLDEGTVQGVVVMRKDDKFGVVFLDKFEERPGVACVGYTIITPTSDPEGFTVSFKKVKKDERADD